MDFISAHHRTRGKRKSIFQSWLAHIRVSSGRKIKQLDKQLASPCLSTFSSFLYPFLWRWQWGKFCDKIIGAQTIRIEWKIFAWCRELFVGEEVRRKGESTSIERQIVNGSINNADMVEWRGGMGGQRGGMVRARNRVSGRGRTITVCRLVFLPVTLHGRKERGKGRGEGGWKRSIGKFSVRSNSGAATFR